jgi:hypothetical protein
MVRLYAEAGKTPYVLAIHRNEKGFAFNSVWKSHLHKKSAMAQSQVAH